MLKKNLRLKKSSDIDKIFIKGDSIKGSLLICKFTPNNLDHNRPCFTIAKKIKLNTPDRNRLKRQLTESYKNISIQSQKVHYDFIFILYKIPSQEFSRFQQFQENFQFILNKLS